MKTHRLPLLLATLGIFANACGPAQPTTFTVKLSNVATDWKYLKAGSFSTPVGKVSPGPIRPGDKYEITFTAGVGHRLSFAAMFGASNDWFFAPAPEGIALYANGEPVSGDVTSQIHLYNAGTEVDEEPGVGPDTGPKQATPDQGAPDTDKTVREIVRPTPLADGTTFNTPAVDQMIRVTLTPTTQVHEFKLTVENVSQADTLMTSQGAATVGISPGVYVIHSQPNALFTLGQPDRGQGLELIAESGRVAMLSDALHAAPLPDSSASGTVTMPEGATSAGPIAPGSDYSFQIEARPGDRFSFASMFGASNDWFAGVSDDGLALFDAQGKPVSGDFTSSLVLWDAGTEQNEEPAVGPNTGPQQKTPESGPADSDNRVRKVDGNTYPVPLSKHLSLTITPKS